MSFKKKEKELSVIIIAKDEEENRKECLESVKWADEIVVVVDERTTDKTAEIAKKYADKIYFKKFEEFSKQYQHALDKATGEWVLKLDADERVTQELKKEIQTKIQNPKICGYHVFFHVFSLARIYNQLIKEFRVQLGFLRKLNQGLLQQKSMS